METSKYLISLAPQVGLEPTTLRLTAECSTIELLRSKAGNAIEFHYNKGPRRMSIPAGPGRGARADATLPVVGQRRPMSYWVIQLNLDLKKETP